MRFRGPALSLFLAAAWPAVAAAQGRTAEDAAARQQAQVRDMVAQSCPPGGEGNDVVVCGRREPVQRYRAPLPDIAAAGRHDRAGGEQLAEMNAGSERCSPAVRDQQCGGGLDMIGIGFTIARAVVQALANRD